ncbi:MAG TPA: hypothetical protein VHO23_01440 [Candidatus Paceibacterota bacterium]|nr:hypothetical protein [Candidatus Paceibacterota bacterium]
MIYALQEYWSYFLDHLFGPLSWVAALVFIAIFVIICRRSIRADEIDRLD